MARLASDQDTPPSGDGAARAGLTPAAIRVARERRGWYQQQLANAIGVSARTVGNWERGETVTPRWTARPRDALGLTDDQPDAANPLARISDAALLAELLRRAVARGDGVG